MLAVNNSDEGGESRDAVFDPSTDSWQTLPANPMGPSYDRQAVWLGDRLLFTSKDLVPSPGAEGPSIVRMAQLDGDLARWSVLPDSEVLGDSPIAVGERVVFPYAGSADGGAVDGWGKVYHYGAVFDPAESLWEPLPVSDNSSAPSGGVGLDLVGETVVGDRLFNLDSSTLFDPASGEVSELPALPGAPRYAAAVLANSTTIIVWGGIEGAENLNGGYILELPKNN
ncbi:MAG: hypothetical protein JWQ43_916 [Glaciihabitans sp.]|nr:hypothetical protein [Glaciihabitans sp.]